MKPIVKLTAHILFVGTISFASCKKEYSCKNCATNQQQSGTNKTPIAVAGPDQVIALPADSISLDGSASSDPDGKISEWLWTKISGPASFNIIKPSDSITVVKDLITGIYRFELKVKDADGLSSKDTTQVIVLAPPADTLSGHEFIFQNLIWQLADDGPGDWIYITVNPSEFFSIPSIASNPVEVSIQLDTTSVWINVPLWDWYPNGSVPSNNGYVWYFPHYPYYDNPYFIIENYPLNYQLVGHAVKVKVKFL